MKKIFGLFIISILLLPSFAFAFQFPALTPGWEVDYGGQLFLGFIIDAIFNLIWIFFGAFAVIMFIYAGMNFLSANGDSAKIATARKAILWGSVGVVVAMIAFSLPFIIQGVLGLTPQTP